MTESTCTSDLSHPTLLTATLKQEAARCRQVSSAQGKYVCLMSRDFRPQG